MNIIVAVLLILFMCTACREEVTPPIPSQTGPTAPQKRDEHISALEREMSNMPQKLAGKGWDTMFWASDLANSIMALEDANQRICLANRYLDLVSNLLPSPNMPHDLSLAFRNYELLVEACTIFKDDPVIAERVLGIMCECVRLHRREVKKWSDAIMNEPNRRARTPLKNIHGCLNSDFMVFTNRIERDYFPWMKAHGLPPDRHEHWRRQLDAAYEMKEAK